MMPLTADFYHVLYGVFSVRACFASDSDSAFPNIASLFLSTGCLLIRRGRLTLLSYFFHAAIIPHLTYKDKFLLTFFFETHFPPRISPKAYEKKPACAQKHSEDGRSSSELCWLENK